MSTPISLPDIIHLRPDQERHNLAIATIVIYGIFLPITWLVEYPASWKGWTSKRKSRNVGRVALKTFIDFLSLLCIIRIIGNALYLSTSNPTKSVFIVQTLFSSLGFLPLVMKLIFVLNRVLQKSHETSAFTHVGRIFIFVRILLLIGIALIIAGACTLILSLWMAGAMVLTAAFIVVAVVHVFLLTKVARKDGALDGTQGLCIGIAAASLPPLTVRAAYLIVIEFSHDGKYNPITGNPAYVIGMVFAMEILIMSALLSATVISEDIFNMRAVDHVALQEVQPDNKHPRLAGNEV